MKEDITKIPIGALGKYLHCTYITVKFRASFWNLGNDPIISPFGALMSISKKMPFFGPLSMPLIAKSRITPTPWIVQCTTYICHNHKFGSY